MVSILLGLAKVVTCRISQSFIFKNALLFSLFKSEFLHALLEGNEGLQFVHDWLR